MYLLEYEAKEIFEKFGIPRPLGGLADNPNDVYEVTCKLNKPVVLKAQVPVGGRGRAGGIRFANNPEEAKKEAERLFELRIAGFKVSRLLVEEKLNVTKEIYLGVTVDDVRGSPVLIASSEGGIDVEELAVKTPENITLFYPDILKGVREYEVRDLIKRIGFKGKLLLRVTDVLLKLYNIFRVYKAEMAEINPLIIKNEEVFAADARLNIDDHALFLHPEIDSFAPFRFESPLELEGKKRGVNYVDLSGNIAIMGNGAGLTMSILDTIKKAGGKPGCFLDTAGALTAERTMKALDLLLMKAESDPGVKAIFAALWFMGTPAEEAVKGLLEAISRRKPKVPIVMVLQGTKSEQAIEIMQKEGIKCYPKMKDGINAVVKLALSGG